MEKGFSNTIFTQSGLLISGIAIISIAMAGFSKRIMISLPFYYFVVIDVNKSLY